MLVSVIIPSYKPSYYLSECILSIYEQNLDKSFYEVIIILNGCNEPYYRMVKNILDDYPDMNSNLIQVDEGGVSNARNIGLREAIGEYITFIDDDDLISPRYLDELLKVSTPQCIGCSNSYSFLIHKEEKLDNFISQAFVKNLNRSYSLISYRQYLSPPVCKMIHRNLIGNHRFTTSLKRSEDSVFCLSLSPKIKSMCISDESAIYYIRNREGSATRLKFSWWDEIHQLYLIEKEYLKIWLTNPLSINFVFFLSRVLGGVYNTWWYYSKSKK